MMNTQQKSTLITLLPTNEKCIYCGEVLKLVEFEVFGVLKKYASRCRCRTKADEERKIQEEHDRKKKRLDKLFRQSNLGERFKNASFEKFQVSKESEQIYNSLKQYAEQFETYKNKSIILFSHPGTGKTLLISAVANTVMKKGFTAIFQTMPDLLTILKSSFNRNDSSEEKLIKGLIEADLLIIDDLGAEYQKKDGKTDPADTWANEKLFQIVNSRYNHMKATIFTTNYMMGQFYKRIGPRIFSRITEMCDGMKFDMSKLPDYRFKNYT